MRNLKLVGLCFAAMLAMGTALVGTASASPLWSLCLEGSGLTKYSSNQCIKAESAGKWQSVGLAPGKEDTVKIVALTLTIRDTKTPAGEVVVQCYGVTAGSGVIEGSEKGEITAFAIEEPTKSCKGIKACKEKEVEEVRWVNLLWKVELFETEKKFLTRLMHGGVGEPGWRIKCKTVVGSETDECRYELGREEQVNLENKVSSAVLLVLGTFQGLKTDCTQGGTDSGEMTGQIALLLNSEHGLISGNGLSISPV